MFKKFAAYGLLPLQARDFRTLAAQWGVVARAFARTMIAADLLPADYLDPDGVDGVYDGSRQKKQFRRVGIARVLRDATSGYLTRARIAWNAGTKTAAGQGVATYVGAGIEGFGVDAAKWVTQGIVVAIAWCAIGTVFSGALVGLGNALVASAHAADAAGLTGGNNGDVGDDMLSTIFLVFGSTGGALAVAFGNMLAIMSTSAFVLAGAGILITSVIMLVEWVYHPDSFSQKYNPWIYVIRAGLALALLFPASNGFNFAQYLALQAIKWGSDKATLAWSAAGSGLGDFNQLVAQPITPKLAETVANLWTVEVCKAAVKYGPLFQANNATVVNSSSTTGSTRFDLLLVDTATVSDVVAFNGGNGVQPSGVAFCGAITNPGVPAGGNVAQSIAQVQSVAFNTADLQVQALATTFVQNNVASICPAQAGGGCVPVNQAPALAAVIASYQNSVSTQLTSIWSNSSGAVDLTTHFSAGGWAAAGAWARRISDANGLLTRVASSVPAVQQPSSENLYGEAADAVTAAADTISATGQIVANNDPSWTGVVGGGTSDTLLDKIFQPVINNVFALVNVDNLQPLASISTIGNNIIFTTEGVVGVAAVIAQPIKGGLAGSVTGRVSGFVGKFIPGPVGWLASLYGKLEGVRDYVAALLPLIWTVGLGLIVTGVGLAYIVPLLPAIRYIFAVVGWLIAVVEVVILLPVMLVLMVSPEGSGLLSPMAKGCFFSVVAVVLRPLVTVMAFVAALLLANVVVTFINAIYLSAFRDSQGGQVWGLVGFLTFFVVYFVLIYVALNSVFKLPETVTHALYRWLGANAGGERDDASGITVAGGVIAGRLTAGLQNLSRGATKR